jgi:hypothetical protein
MCNMNFINISGFELIRTDIKTLRMLIIKTITNYLYKCALHYKDFSQEFL